MKTITINVDDELLNKYNTEQLKKFIRHQLMKLENDEMVQEIMHLSESSLDFWDNKIDDEAWNDL